MSNKDIKEYDGKGNLIYLKYSPAPGYEYWYKYDENNNRIHFKSSSSYECWYEYDENNNETHYKSTSGHEYWREYDKNNNMIYFKNSNDLEYWWKYIDNTCIIITEQEFKQIERTKLYLNIKRSNRFEIMDI